LVRATCTSIAMTEAKLNLSYEITKGSIQFPRFMQTLLSPAHRAVTTLGTAEGVPEITSEQPWQQKGGNASAMSEFRGDSLRPDLKEMSPPEAAQKRTPII